MSTQFSFGASRTGGALGEARPSAGGGEGAGTSTALGFPPSEARGRQGREGHRTAAADGKLTGLGRSGK